MSKPEPELPDWRTMRGMLRSAGNLQDELAKERAAELARDDARMQSLEKSWTGLGSR